MLFGGFQEKNNFFVQVERQYIIHLHHLYAIEPVEGQIM